MAKKYEFAYKAKDDFSIMGEDISEATGSYSIALEINYSYKMAKESENWSHEQLNRKIVCDN